MNFSCWECADDGCLGTMVQWVSLLIGLLYASLQLPLDNRENKNSRNVCLSQIRENIFPRKFLLIQYINIFNWFPQSTFWKGCLFEHTFYHQPSSHWLLVNRRSQQMEYNQRVHCWVPLFWVLEWIIRLYLDNPTVLTINDAVVVPCNPFSMSIVSPFIMTISNQMSTTEELFVLKNVKFIVKT